MYDTDKIGEWNNQRTASMYQKSITTFHFQRSESWHLFCVSSVVLNKYFFPFLKHLNWSNEMQSEYQKQWLRSQQQEHVIFNGAIFQGSFEATDRIGRRHCLQ